MMGLGVDVERGVGSVMPIQVTRIAGADGVAGSRGGYLSIVHATGNIEKVMDESRKVAMTGILGRAEELKIDLKHLDDPIHLHFMGGSTKKDGPSAGGAIALALASILSGSKIRRDVAMTGEIDTKGRITAVGALAVKIETAHDAGCRTVIIPKENLYGEGGIERLPEALKRELQILTFEQWNGVHEPFDYSNHILQVVAVDDVVQAAGVAAIDEEELKSVEGLFDEYAREVARLLGERLRRPEACFQVVQVKTTEEMGTDGAPWGIPEAGSRLVLLPLPEVRDTARARADRWGAHVRVRAFDPGEEQLIDLVKELRESHGTDSGRACTVALVAPYYLLMRDSIRPLEGLTLFANNFTLQTVKIKGCKNLLDRVFCLLSLLDPSRLESCPFVGTMNGIHVLDISFIPEKYRLDLRRAEEIAISTLGRWADSVMELFRHG
jgi:ATP-dependent Lon protease